MTTAHQERTRDPSGSLIIPMSDQRVKTKARIQGVLWFLCMMIFVSTMFTLAFFISGWIYQLTGFTPPPIAVQWINSIGGLFLTALVILIMSRIFRHKIMEGQMKIFSPMIDALERISKGDFSVRIDPIGAGNPNDDGRGFKQLAESINQMAVELDQMEAMRQEFISNVSHEIQSPLTSIRGFAQALKSDTLGLSERHDYLTIIETESTRLSKLTENLLKLASLESDQVKFDPQPYRLDRQIRTLILACEPQWMGKDIELDVSLDEVEITADEDLLSQVWINLLSNSIKFTPREGRICIHLGCEDDQITFLLEDTGIGISEDDQAHIFERFYKADKARHRTDQGGSGLGLSIVHNIIERHHGTIRVESKLGMGTTFVVTLPVKTLAEGTA